MKNLLSKINPKVIYSILAAILVISNITIIAVSNSNLSEMRRMNQGLAYDIGTLQSDVKLAIDGNGNALLNARSDILSAIDGIEFPEQAPVEFPEYPTPYPIPAPVVQKIYVYENQPEAPKEQAPAPAPVPTPEPQVDVPLQIIDLEPVPLANLEPNKQDKKVIVTITAPKTTDMFGYQFKMNYDAEQLKFDGGLKSNIDSIKMIFSKSFSGYELVGATMIGEVPGYTQSQVNVCEMTFDPLEGFDPSGLKMSISEVTTVDSKLISDEAVSGWKVDVKYQD